MSAEKNVPELRFKGFSGEWEERNLGEIGTLKNGMNFDKTAMGHGHPFVNLQDVFGKNEVNSENLGLAFSTENQRKDYSLNEGDVLFIRSSVKPEGVGEAAVVSKIMENTTYSGFIIRFRPNIEMDLNFNRFVYSTTNSRKQILANSTSSANTNINQDALQRIQLTLPCKQEQTAIGNTFQKLDSLINQHQQKHDQLNNIKKAMLEKMFPKQGETTPEIRFKGFSGEWEKVKLKQIAKIRRGLTYRPDDILESGVVVLRSSNINVDKFELRKDDVQVSLSAVNISLIKNGDILITSANGSSNLVGKHAIVNGLVIDAVHGGFMLIAETKIPEFLNASMDTYWYEKFLSINVSGGNGAIGNIKGSALEEENLYVPNKEEQTAIGNYFQKLDRLISQHQNQITKLNHIKQACLSKMFV